jgi:predicted kinase
MAASPTADDIGGRSVSVALPADALVVLIGVAGSGKSTFAARHFSPTQVLSSDAFRALIADSPSARGATDDAFDLLHRLLGMRLRRGLLTVVDATNVEDWARAKLTDVARLHHRPCVAIILDVGLEVALERNAARPALRPPPSAIRRQAAWLRDSLPAIAHEGFAAIIHLHSVEEIDAIRLASEQPR